MKSYLQVRRLVDRDLGSVGYTRAGSRSIVIAMLLMGVPALLFEGPWSIRMKIAVALSIAASSVWLAFVAWRGARMLHVVAIRRDRAYDRHDKHVLAAEYATTESATRAARRR